MNSNEIINLLDPPDSIPLMFVGNGVSIDFNVSNVMKITVTVPIVVEAIQ